MRRLLISAATLGLLAAPALVSSAWAQPDDSRRGGRDNAAPQAQQDQPQQGSGDRGGERGMTHTNTLPPGWTPPAGTPMQQGRGNGQGNRGTAQAPAAQPVPQDQGNRGNSQGRGGSRDFNRPNNYQGNNQGNNYGNNGRDFNRSDNRSNSYQGNNYGNNRGYGNPGNGGQRHDFSSFREFHRDFNAPRRFRGPDYRRPQGWYDHRWTFGEFLPRTYWVRDYWLDDFYDYGLPPPPYGAVWVRVGSDALLIDQDSGEVITVEYSVFY